MKIKKSQLFMYGLLTSMVVYFIAGGKYSKFFSVLVGIMVLFLVLHLFFVAREERERDMHWKEIKQIIDWV